ncbi:YbaB/EbfC family nucleoid-associated protein [Actinokineospora iranica]|uniref:Conserved DNA-binding protein YbaB n=1 Tax=Actinokineospora iranica TaxID=1271860 RepID=A0A1G6ZEY3_9PSEU|nr:YbaB/EbfC family nucleoid-associated protein [Actinokineospora iranica]SDE01209.1 Conserved DNA-binding protein YbaB [Actinokineospora iranica]
MTEPAFGVDAATTNAGLDRWASEIQAKADRYNAMQQQVTAITATASSQDGTVTITVDSAGAVTAIHFTEDLKRLPATAMADQVLTTMRAAQAKITDQVTEIVQTTVGDDPATAEAMISAYRSRFPEPDATVDRPTDDDDDFGGSIFH